MSFLNVPATPNISFGLLVPNLRFSLDSILKFFSNIGWLCSKTLSHLARKQKIMWNKSWNVFLLSHRLSFPQCLDHLHNLLADILSALLYEMISNLCEYESRNVLVKKYIKRSVTRLTLPYNLDGSNFFSIESKRLIKGGALMKSQPTKRPE